MSEPIRPEEPEHLACDYCRREIPASAALTSEAQDYVLHFCGIACADHWRREHDAQHQTDAGANPDKPGK